MISPNRIDFSLIDNLVSKFVTDHNLKDKPSGFYYLILDQLFQLQPDEIEDSITDNYFQVLSGKSTGHDRGIDAVYIDSSLTPPTVNLFNFKYNLDFKNLTDHFPSKEIDKIISFVSSLLGESESLKDEVNQKLYEKILEIWDILKKEIPNFVIHFCTNGYQKIENLEFSRLENEIKKYNGFSTKFHLAPDLVKHITHKNQITVDAKIRAIDTNYFEKTDGDIRALIFAADAREVLRIVLKDETLRNDTNIQDYGELLNSSILEDAFEDNVRIYLAQKSNINKNIQSTASSKENHRFFYFNNGITFTCKKYNYLKQSRNPIIDIKDLQVVNGSQTIHALFEAYKTNSTNFSHVELLCRVYETENRELSTSIAEYTNSQNPVESRDIRSNDFIQKKLEIDLNSKGYFYERKRWLYSDKPLKSRIDAEKAGQVLLAFYLEMPAEAKDNKKIIFGEKYTSIFHQNLTAEAVLLPLLLFNKINETYQTKRTLGLNEDFLVHSSYYILYLLGKKSKEKSIELTLENLENIWKQYRDSISLIADLVKNEQKNIGKRYSHRTFFKGNRPKILLESIL